MTGADGRVIFTKLSGNTKINLQEGPFQVLDANGTDGNGASFQLPNPDPDGDGVTAYSVYARALGRSGSPAAPRCHILRHGLHRHILLHRACRARAGIG